MTSLDNGRSSPRMRAAIVRLPFQACEHPFVTSQESAFMRFRRALDGRNVTEALSAASELGFVGLAEALELTLLLADKEPEKYDRAAVRWHLRFVLDSKNVDLRDRPPRESHGPRAARGDPGEPFSGPALAELLSRRRGLERPCETLRRMGEKPLSKKPRIRIKPLTTWRFFRLTRGVIVVLMAVGSLGTRMGTRTGERSGVDRWAANQHAPRPI